MRQKQFKTKVAPLNDKLKFVIFQHVNVISLLLLQILAAIENYKYSRMRTLHMISAYYITTTSVLITLSQLAGVGNFCFNLVPSFPSIVRILSFKARLLQILLYALFPRFSWSTLFPFPSYFNFHNRMTWPCHRRWFWIIISSIFTTTPYESVLLHRSSWSYLIRNSKFPCFTTVQQNWSKTTLINLPPLLQR